MKKHLAAYQLLLFLGIVFIGLGFNGCAPPSARTVQKSESPQRLISTVPSITEVLFDIGLGDRIVGDSRFTTYPPETKSIEKIGDLYNTNWESIIRLKPDLVLVLIENEEFRNRLQNLGIETLSVDHRSMDGVLASYDLIGERLGPDIMQAAQARKAVLEEKLQTLRSKAASFPPVRVLLCLDRTRGSGRLQDLYVAGTNSYFQDAIRWAGGINVAETTGLPVPNVSVEGVVAMNPDVIVDLMISTESVTSEEHLNGKKQNTINLTSDWKTLGNAVNAVKTGRIYVFTEDYATIPGPRTPIFMEKLMKTLHPCDHGEGIKQRSNDLGTCTKRDDGQ